MAIALDRNDGIGYNLYQCSMAIDSMRKYSHLKNSRKSLKRHI